MSRQQSHRRIILWGVITVGLAIAATLGCKRPPENLGDKPVNSYLEFTGKITWVDLEGGFWGILRDEGDAKYRPTNLPEQYQQNGMRVRVNCERIKTGFSVYQWGQEIKIITIESIK